MKLNTNTKKWLLIISLLTTSSFFNTQVKAAPLMDTTHSYINIVTTQNSPLIDIPNEIYTRRLNINDSQQHLFLPGTVNTNKTYIRQQPSLTGNILGEAHKGQILEVTGISNDWIVINFHGGTAYVHSSYIDQSTTLMANQNSPLIDDKPTFAIAEPEDGLFVQLGAYSLSEQLTKLPSGSILEVIGSDGEFTKVLVGADIGYVESGLIYIYNGDSLQHQNRPTTPNTPQEVNPQGVEIVNYSKQFLGTPYIWGGTDLTYGVDCSGFTYKVMKNNGVTINRVSHDQVNSGTIVQRHELQKADLIFFDTNGPINNGNISHVGLYIGNDYFIHASSSPIKPYVIISNLNKPFYANSYVTASRVI